MEWIPHDKEEEEEIEESIQHFYYIPGCETEVPFSIYRMWCNANRGKKPGLE